MQKGDGCDYKRATLKILVMIELLTRWIRGGGHMNLHV